MSWQDPSVDLENVNAAYRDQSRRVAELEAEMYRLNVVARDARSEAERFSALLVSQANGMRAAIEHASTREHFVRRLRALIDELGVDE